ncbi:hypothetical protein SLA2020_201200 [Shorea laevis]
MPAVSFPRLLLASFIAFFLANFALAAATLPDDELEALRDIARTLRKADWNFSVDPCSGDSGWVLPSNNRFANSITCSNGTTPHVVSM